MHVQLRSACSLTNYLKLADCQRSCLGVHCWKSTSCRSSSLLPLAAAAAGAAAGVAAPLQSVKLAESTQSTSIMQTIALPAVLADQRVLVGGVCVAGLLLLRALLLWVLSPILAARQREALSHPSENTFSSRAAHGGADTLTPFGTLSDPPTKLLSVIVPAYNEQDRLPHMLDATMNYLDREANRDPDFTYEVLVVDDGSTDGTSKVSY
jgi:Glycosyl transferase family 2